jgi:penicillin amidase
VTAFVDGINAAVEEANRRPDDLPLDFHILGIRPEKWTPAVVISRHNGLLSNLTQEVDMAQAVRVMGAAKVKDLSQFYGRDPILDMDPAIDASLINDDIVALYTAFRSQSDLRRNRSARNTVLLRPPDRSRWRRRRTT